MLTANAKVGSYEIVAPIGSGGMGEVYRARDAKLGRDVALKVLPEAFARDAERMARFQREAKLLASLNHPNIAAIYGFEDSGDTRALVMELVEGPTLADRISSGPIPIDEALPIAKQICDALEYAHERGIVHRDLKPSNIKISRDDTVKILDFGLAKAMERDAAEADLANSPTISRMATQAGIILGTAAYMSPDQAKAKPVDRRADIWAFGCVLFEMLTGKTAFHGETVTDILAAVIRAEPDWSRLPKDTPVRIRVLLQRCLQKDPKQRLRDIGDARISLDEVMTGAPLESPAPTELVVSASSEGRKPFLRGVLWGVAGLIVGIAAGMVLWNLKPTDAPPRTVSRFSISLPPGDELAALDYPAITISRDGAQLAYVAVHSGTQRVYLRSLNRLQSKPVPDTDGAYTPFFSPDGQWLGFFSGARMRKISIAGDTAVTIVNSTNTYGASWGGDGTIAFAHNVGTLDQISDSGGASKPLSHLTVQKGETAHTWPSFLPDGHTVLYVAGPTPSQVAIESLDSGQQRNLGPTGTFPQYAASGHLVYAQEGNLMAVSFDPKRLQVTSAPVPVLNGVLQLANGSAQYSMSDTGTLIYIPGTAEGGERQLVWVNRSGREQILDAPPRHYFYPRISPDGHRLAVTVREQGAQVWLYDFARGTLARLTFDAGENEMAAWTPDGKRIATLSNKYGPTNILWELADGSSAPERLTTSQDTTIPGSFSSDGQYLAYVDISGTTGYDIWVMRMSDRKSEPFLHTSASETTPRFSPNGHWLAYVSDESGRYEVYVQPYPGPGGKYQISSDGGTEPIWNPNGRELFYRSGDKMMAVDVSIGTTFSAGKPKMLFQGTYLPTSGTFPFYDISPDGQRFLMLKSAQQTGSFAQIVVVQNWFEELKRAVPTSK